MPETSPLCSGHRSFFQEPDLSEDRNRNVTVLKGELDTCTRHMYSHNMCALFLSFFTETKERNNGLPNIFGDKIMTKIPTISDFVYFVFVLEETLENIKVVYDQGSEGNHIPRCSFLAQQAQQAQQAPAQCTRHTGSLSHFRTFALSHFRTLHALYALYAFVRHLYRLVCTVSECLTTSEHFQLHRGAGTKFDISI